ncbi:MAG: M6 family metalloprotease domain-containing protein, partial [Synergistaceae bacterium]|nr:M6 family metalloprotease domain-containing protein [Synergistaceae bacterium]
MKKRRLLLLPALFLSVLASLSFWPLTHEARAIPAYPEMLIHSQSNGDVINYYIKGDEFLNWMTDANGWLVSFGDTEETSADLYQAEWISENQAESARENVSEGVPEEESWPAMGVIKATTPLLDHKLTPPRPGGMPPNIREEVPPEYLAHIAAEAAAWRDAASAAMREGADSSASKSAPQLIVRSPAAAVTRKGVVIYVRFPNDSRVRNVNFGVSDETFLNNYMFGSGDKSVASFYRDNTGGAAQIGPANESQGTANDGVIVVNLSGNHGNWGGSIGGTWASDLFAAALQGAAPYINFASYDTNNDGTIEPTELFIALVVQGGESSYGDNIPSVWGLSVRWSNPGVSISGISKRFVNVFQQGATQGGRPLTIGIGAHELGHALFGFPDLYDVGGNCPGFGYWSLMAQGSWSYQSGERPGATPSMIDAYCLYSAGLVTPDAILNSSSSGTYTASGHTGIYRVSASSPNQYFLLQPRDAATPRDRGAFYMIPSGGVYSSYLRKGLMIIHVDQSVTGSFNSGAQPHPGRAVEEAHGGGFNLLYPKYNTNAGGNNGDIA